MLTTFCMLSAINPMTKPESVDPILINMERVTVVRPQPNKGKATDGGTPSVILMDGKHFVVRESVQEIYDACVK